MFDKLKKLFGGQAGAWSSYEGASYSNKRRHVPGSSPTDNHNELNSSTRSELVKASRYVSKNSGVAKEIISSNQLYAVGDAGIKPKPQGGSDGWKKKALGIWDDWSKYPTMDGRYSFVEVQRMVSRLLDEDGECFVYKVQDEKGNPKIQIIESHRIGNWDAKADDYIDGIKFDRWGRPVRYCFMSDSGVVQKLKADSVLHVFDPERPSAARSAPALSHSTNHLRDAMELLSIEKHAVKMSSDVVHVLNTENAADDGEFMPVDAGETTDPNTLQRITGGKVVTTQNGESLNSFESNRPNSTFTGFLDYLDRDTTLGVLPYEFVVDPSKPTGAGVRLVVAKADRRFQWRSKLLAYRLIEPLWFFVMGSHIAKGELTAPKDWHKIKCGSPRRVTVDQGRERREDREDVMAGLKNLGDHFDEQGKDFAEEVEQRAMELKMIEEISKKYGVDSGKVLSLLTVPEESGNTAGDNAKQGSSKA